MTRGRIIALTLVLALAFGLRLFVVPIAWGRVPLGDPHNYTVIAENMLAGRGMVIDDPWLVPNLRAFYPPLYPALMALTGLFAPLNPLSLMSLNFAIDVGAAAAIVWLATLLGSSRAGYAAGAAWLIWPNNVLGATFAQKEGLVTLLVVMAIALILYSARSSRLVAPVAMGVCTALLALTQPGLALLPGALAIALVTQFPSSREWLYRMAIAACACLLTMTPWWIRNYLIFDSFVPLTTATGMTWWIGIQPGGRWVPAPERLLAPELEMSRLAATEAWAWVRAHPTEYLADCIRRGVRMLMTNVAFAADLFQMVPRRPVPLNALATLTAATHLILLVITVVIAALRRNVLSWVLLVCVVYFFLFQTWFVGAERLRYHLTAIALLIVFSFVIDRWDAIRFRRMASAT